jgi:TRAP-type C4-dicarboxylate transport system permease small subunit
MAPEIHTPVTAEEIAHVFDDQPVEVDLSSFAFEDWVAIAIFWVMTLSVITQFYTRYVLNDSYAWTEEIAINCLVGVVFVGSAMCVRLTRHIHVDFIYRYLPEAVGRVLATVVGVIRVVFFGYAGWLFYKYSSIISDERMTTVDLPKSIVFYTVVAAFALMTVRAIQVLVQDLARGYSPLERPSAFDGSEA